MTSLEDAEGVLRWLIDGHANEKIVRAFFKFHQANPQVYELVERFADQMAARRSRYGMAAVYERMRWEIHMTTEGDDDFKLSNNHKPYYARLWTIRHPERFGFFQLKRLGYK